MDRDCRSAWHAGGTRPPFARERGGSRTEIRYARATGIVPRRATGKEVDSQEPLVTGEDSINLDRSGTKWHDRPRGSARGHGRA